MVKGGWAYTAQGMVPGFGGSKVVTVGAGVDFNLKGVLAIAFTAETEYWIDGDASNKATVPAGTIRATIPGVTKYNFTGTPTLEVLMISSEHEA